MDIQDRIIKMNVIVISLFIVAGMAAFIGWNVYKTERWPCRYKSYASLTAEYPSLNEIWNRKIAYLDAREAAEKIVTAKLELAVKRGYKTDAEKFKIEQKMFEQTLAGEQKYENQFQTECKRLTGVK